MRHKGIRQHEMRHRGENPPVCDIGECRQVFTDRSDLKRHQERRHGLQRSKIRPLFVCDVTGCPFTTRYPSKMTVHTSDTRGYNRIHVTRVPTWLSRTRYGTTSRVRIWMRNLLCATSAGASGHSPSQNNLTKHKKTHTIKGQPYRKTQEKRVNKLLKE